MADAKKKSAAGDSKEKNALLDLDIGKDDFLSSWKSMSAADGDGDGNGMNFDLPPVSKGSKKPFNFDKSDMDFNLDGDFGKLSSFDMDMSDLDISPPFKKDGKCNEKSKESSNGNEKGKSDWNLSSFGDMTDFDISPPLKKDGKSKEKSKEPTSENAKGKADGFSFAFDFDELDDFNFEPSLAKKDSKAHKDNDDKFDPCSTKESSKVQKDKDGIGSGENINFMSSLMKEGSMARKDEDKVESSENSNFKPSLAKECLKTPKEKDGFGGSENLGLERSIAEEGSKMHNYKDSSENLPRIQNMEASRPMNFTGSMSNIEEGNKKPPLVRDADVKSTREYYPSKLAIDEPVTGSMSNIEEGNKKPPLVRDADVKSTREYYPSKLAVDEPVISNLLIGEPVSSTCSAATVQVSVDRSEPQPEIVIASTEPPEAIQSDKSLSIEPVDHETSNGNGFKIFSDSRSNNAPSGCNFSISDAPDTSDIMGAISTVSVEEKDANVTSDVDPNCNYKYKLSKISPHFRTIAISEKDNNEKIQNGIENHVMVNKEQTERSEVNSQVINHSVNNVVPEILTDKPTGGENQKHASQIAAFASVSQNPDKLLPDKETKNGETYLTRPGSVIQSEKPKAPAQKAPLTLTTDFPLSSKKTDLAQPSLVEGKRNQENNQSDRKLASVPMQKPQTLLRMELPKTKSHESCKSIDIVGERDPDIAGVQKMKTLNDSFSQNLDLVKAKPAARQRGASVKDLHTISSLATPPSLKMEVNKKTAQITLASLSSLKRNPVEAEKLSAAEGIKKKPELCSPKLSSLDSMKSPNQNEMRFAGNIRQTSVLLRNTQKNFAPLDSVQKRTSSPLSLKRKSLEEHNADTVMLYPSKRVSQSPSLSRNFMETSKSAFDKKVSYNETMRDDCIKNTLGTYQVSASDIFHKVNGRTMEMSVYIENDINIKQAEAYTKELDDICNMLRMKQEDAKELLVRATVNSNRMLMLNYHHIEKKIGAMKNYFAKLSSISIRA